ncbi:MAG: hypothetical protein K2N73_18315 [Lachnospiraceae bacterium]|nr:hypothetical protein [Lachnospiraceae bacterium]
MAMEINGSYSNVQTSYLEKLKEEQPLDKTSRAGEIKEGQKEEKAPAHDEYISSEKSGANPTGLYWLGEDENGNRKIFFDDPKKSNPADAKEPSDKKTDNAEDSDTPKVKADEPKKVEEKCTGDTGKVDREIEKLKEKKKQLEQQIQSAAGDEKKVQELERKLAQVENELSQKDNETYRRNNTIFT